MFLTFMFYSFLCVITGKLHAADHNNHTFNQQVPSGTTIIKLLDEQTKQLKSILKKLEKTITSQKTTIAAQKNTILQLKQHQTKKQSALPNHIDKIQSLSILQRYPKTCLTLAFFSGSLVSFLCNKHLIN